MWSLSPIKNKLKIGHRENHQRKKAVEVDPTLGVHHQLKKKERRNNLRKKILEEEMKENIKAVNIPEVSQKKEVLPGKEVFRDKERVALHQEKIIKINLKSVILKNLLPLKISLNNNHKLREHKIIRILKLKKGK